MLHIYLMDRTLVEYETRTNSWNQKLQTNSANISHQIAVIK